MADIPLNIDTPSGAAFTINKSLLVGSDGRINLHIRDDTPYLRFKDGGVRVGVLSAAYDTSLTLPVKAARLMAYEILKLTDEKQQS